MVPKRDAERAARIAKFERDRDAIDLQFVRNRQTGNIRHLNAIDALRDALAKDLKALDDRYAASCAAGGSAPEPSALPSTDPAAGSSAAPLPAAS